jgi:hypothetical protein
MGSVKDMKDMTYLKVIACSWSRNMAKTRFLRIAERRTRE